MQKLFCRWSTPFIDLSLVGRFVYVLGEKKNMNWKDCVGYIYNLIIILNASSPQKHPTIFPIFPISYPFSVDKWSGYIALSRIITLVKSKDTFLLVI